jgi:hypothetical protein
LLIGVEIETYSVPVFADTPDAGFYRRRKKTCLDSLPSTAQHII